MQQQQQQALAAHGVQLANIPQSHLGPITSTQTSMNWYSGSQPDSTNISSPHHVQMMHEQYPTPPSTHNSHIGTDGTPQHVTNGYPAEHFYLTPSESESPGEWSSSSPHSAQSDWSEGISSPTQPVVNMPSNKTSAKRENASVYI